MAALKFAKNHNLLTPEINLSPVPRHIYVGVSGGLDSVVLLDWVYSLFRSNADICITVLHVHHHLQPEADDWAEFVANLARHYELNFKLMHLDPHDYEGKNKEACARKGRYAFFASELHSEQDYLFLAHHAQDQVETFFLNLQRGAGLAGLSAMPYQRRFAKGFLVRPFLTKTRSELEHYAKAQHLQWVEDPSNQDMRLNRNFLRQQILPLLNTRWPHFDKQACNAITHLQQARTILDDYLQNELHTIATAASLDLQGLQLLPQNRHRLLLQMWIKQNTAKILSATQLNVIMNEVIHARPDCIPLFEIPGLQIRRVKNRLVLSIK